MSDGVKDIFQNALKAAIDPTLIARSGSELANSAVFDAATDPTLIVRMMADLADDIEQRLQGVNAAITNGEPTDVVTEMIQEATGKAAAIAAARSAVEAGVATPAPQIFESNLTR